MGRPSLVQEGPSQQPTASRANPVVKNALLWGQGPLKRWQLGARDEVALGLRENMPSP